MNKLNKEVEREFNAVYLLFMEALVLVKWL